MPLVQTIKEKTKKYRRYFVKSANTSVAANTEETLLSISGPVIIRSISVAYDGDDTTGTSTSTLSIEADGNTILNGYTLGEIYTNLAGYCIATGGGFHVVCTKYSDSVKQYFFVFILDTYVSSSFVVKLKNADTTNAAIVKNGVIYDVEV